MFSGGLSYLLEQVNLLDETVQTSTSVWPTQRVFLSYLLGRNPRDLFIDPVVMQWNLMYLTGLHGTELTTEQAVDLFLDLDSHVPLKKSYSWRDPVDKQRDVEEELYDNYRVVQGINTPYGFTRFFNGDMQSERFVKDVHYDQGLDQAMFDPNSGYNPNKPAKKK